MLYTFKSLYQDPEPLFEATTGTFYGVTAEGGSNNSCERLFCGIVFSLDMGLGPFVETLPTFGEAAAIINILETNLDGPPASPLTPFRRNSQ